MEYKEKGLDQNLNIAISFDMNRQYTSFSMALLACLSHANIDEEFFSEIMHHGRELYLLMCFRSMKYKYFINKNTNIFSNTNTGNCTIWKLSSVESSVGTLSRAVGELVLMMDNLTR